MVKFVWYQYYEICQILCFLVHLSALDLPHDHKTCTSNSNCDIHCGHEHHGKACIGGKCYCIGKHESGACDRRSTPVAFKWRGFEKKLPNTEFANFHLSMLFCYCSVHN